MKKSILIKLITAFLVAIVLWSCDSSLQKVEDAEGNVIEASEDLDRANKDLNEANKDLNSANKDLNKANEEHLADIEAYKKMTTEKIEANNQQIIAFKERIAKEEKITKEDFEKLVAEVEEKNRLLLDKLNNYKINGKSDWEVFKIEFNRDMKELGNAFKNITVKNVK